MTNIIRFIALLAGVCVVTSSSVAAHDLFFRARHYLVAPGEDAWVDVYTGTFSKSENAVKRDRPVVLELVTPSAREPVPRERWDDSTDPTSVVRITTGAPGTYLLAAYLKPRLLSLPADKFNAYLKDEGLDDILALRKVNNRMAEPSKERYQKFIKTLIQVGDAHTAHASTVLGYDAEIVPEQNPSALKPGNSLTVRCIVKGRPWANRVIFAGGRVGRSDRRIPPQRLTTDAEGRATVRLTTAGVWYVKFVSMLEIEGDEDANYESRWSTISFAVGAAGPRVGWRLPGHRRSESTSMTGVQ
ncbi:MAG TPA: DUF4198 domain-containing protein [Gemmatimonadaceae bacterium]|nr:DUF4198 domain-containing protein [Gemmatimonadaceae bacterium]